MEQAEAPSFRGVPATQAGRVTDPKMELRNPWVVRLLPRTERRLLGQPRQRMHCGLSRSRVTCGLRTLVVRGVRMARPLCRRHRAKIHVSMPLEVMRGCRAVMALLLTLLEV